MHEFSTGFGTSLNVSTCGIAFALCNSLLKLVFIKDCHQKLFRPHSGVLLLNQLCGRSFAALLRVEIHFFQVF